MAANQLALPSAVSLLEAQIERKKATGQRFPAPLTVSVEDSFRSARRAPNEQVRQSVRAQPSPHRRLESTIIEVPPRDTSPKKSTSPGRDGGLNKMNQSFSSQAGVLPAAQQQNQFRVNVCQRVEPPKDLNTPPRVNDDASVVEEMHTDGSGTGKAANLNVNRRQAAQTKMRDQEMLAFACRRANKTRNEALAYYNMGVLHDNEKEYEKAIRCYEQYLQAARGAGDAKGEQLALNSIGIDWYKLAEYDKAIDVHNQHLQMADIPGKFVAHCNLGLAFFACHEPEKASLNHRQALRYAIVMSSLVGESLACGNLGIIGSQKGDVKTAKACMERHLKLATALKDSKAQLDACHHLGKLANDSGEYAEAASYFEQARALAIEAGNSKLATQAKCLIGIANGNAQFEDYVASVSAQLQGDGYAD